MLTSLYIQNLAVIKKATISFTGGMNLFTGETGAGKSIVVDAVGALMGGRCFKEMVRSGESKALVIGTFEDLPEAAVRVIQKYEWEYTEDELIVQREISADGRTTARIGGMPVTIASLRELGQTLINIHGQHDTQILFSPEKHMELLDRFGDLGALLSQYQEHFTRLGRIRKDLARIRKEQEEKDEKIAELQRQIHEIEKAQLEVGEDTRLEQESRAIKNAERILENLELAHQNLSGSEDVSGAVDLLMEAVSNLEVVSEYYQGLGEQTDQLRDLSYQVQEIAREVDGHLEDLEFNPAQIDVIESRLDEIFKLKRKYGSTIEDVLATLQENQNALEEMELYDIRLNELIVGERSEQKQVNELAEQLTEARRETAREFVQAVSEELRFLDMKGVVLHVHLTPCEYNVRGKEQIEFFISTNVGEPPKPIAKVASGGELSRIMLSIKNVLAGKDEIPTMIFDEVDTGVSGSAAQKIGLKLRQASKDRQILCVTHLAQIAALADEHFRIQKAVKNGQTYTEVVPLDRDGRIEEVARMMSTGTITDLMLQTARELIDGGEASGR